MTRELEGQVAFVTGAGSGIGKAAAIKLAKEGATVAVVGHNQKHLDKTAAAIREAGGDAIALQCDVRYPDEVKACVERTVKTYGRIDIVVPNAGVNGTWTAIDELTPDEWDETVDTNLKGTYLTLHYTVPHLKKAGGGSVVIIASVNGTRIFSNTGATAYSCTKAAQVAMTKMLALELAPDKIRVNAVCPGAIDTNIDDNTELENEDIKIPVEFPEGKIPLTAGKPGKSEQVADLILFLASSRASHISGTPVWIDGAESLIVG